VPYPQHPLELQVVPLRALHIGGFAGVNPHYLIRESANIPKDAPTDLWDDALHQLSLQTQKEWTKLMMEEATRDPRFRLNEGTVTLSSGIFLVMNSHGTHKLEAETAASWSLMGMGVDGPVITSFDYFGEIARRAAATPERIVSSTRSFRDQLLRNLKQGPAKSYKGLVVFSPRAVIDILLSNIAYHLNARTVVEKTSRWNLGKIGQETLNPQLTLRDMPWLTDRSGCSVFDREGTPTANRTLVERGILRGFLVDHYASQALGIPSSGNAAGSPSSVPTVSSHCLCLDRGDEPLDKLLHRVVEKQKDFLLVQRYSGQVDPVTGDFSGVAKGSEWWHGGERAYCVNETLISGNLFEALGNGLYGISRETEIVDSAEESPTLVVDNVSVTSGK
jgi:PmbA protein